MQLRPLSLNAQIELFWDGIKKKNLQYKQYNIIFCQANNI